MLPSNAGKEVIRPLHTLVPYAVVKSRLIIVLSIDLLQYPRNPVSIFDSQAILTRKSKNKE